MKRPYRLVTDVISHETIRCLEQLLEMAKRGEAIGIAYAVMFKGRNFSVNAAGEAYQSPTFSRGMIRALDDKLGRIVLEDRIV